MTKNKNTAVEKYHIADYIQLIGIYQSAQHTCQGVFDTLTEFQKGTIQYDDITLVVRRL